MINARTATAIAAATLLAGWLGGCAAKTSTRVTVMNESNAALLVDAARADTDTVVVADERLEPGDVRALIVEHADNEDAPVRVGVRPVEFSGIPAQWLDFPAGGPFLLRIRGDATALQFLQSEDRGGTNDRGPEPRFQRRLGGDPPPNPS